MLIRDSEKSIFNFKFLKKLFNQFKYFIFIISMIIFYALLTIFYIDFYYVNIVLKHMNCVKILRFKLITFIYIVYSLVLLEGLL